MNTASTVLEAHLERNLPRILTQISRDPTSPTYGCCDRNWWHYKIRDFPSVILQQAGYTIAEAAKLASQKHHRGALLQLARQTAVFWNSRAVRFGSFEEYYPFERGYPPLAFSTLGVAKLCQEGVVSLADVRAGLEEAAAQLLHRFERQAANQQIAGTAALAVLNNLAPDLVPKQKLADLLDQTYALQVPEGWFPEYDGPDLGYLSVSMDCIWDIFDATRDDRAIAAIESALEFIAWFVLGPDRGAGMHNSRNTDYIVPYGIARLASENTAQSALARQVMRRLFSPDIRPHFLDAVDDRYWCHYIGHSVVRAIKVIRGDSSKTEPLPTKQISVISDSRMASGHLVLESQNNAPKVLVSGKKGGIFTAKWEVEGASLADFGWILRTPKGLFVSHWWSDDWEVLQTKDQVTCRGQLYAHREVISTPLKHIALRVASAIMGARLIELLKRVMIFKGHSQQFDYERSFRIDGRTLHIEDSFQNLPDSYELIRASRSSKRHVASADSFHEEDLQLSSRVRLNENRVIRDTFCMVTSRYSAVGSKNG